MRALEGETFDDLAGGTDDAKGYVSLRTGPEPRVEVFDDLASERAFLVSEIQRLIQEEHILPSHICIAARTHRQIDESYGPALTAAGIDTEKLGRGRPRTDAVRLATMHRIKGLEFPVVLLAPLPTPESRAPDPVVRAHALKRERALLAFR
jgi:superfamily I DNA/RNA helicase